MTRDEIVAIIKQRMGNYNDSTIDAHIVTEMKLNQINMEQEASLPWFLNARGTVTVSADTAEAGALTFDRSGTTCNFLAEYEEVPLATFLTATETVADKVYMDKDDYAALWNANQQGEIKPTTDGHPSRYAHDVGVYPVGRFTAFPTPTAAWTLVAEGYYADVPLATDITNLWLTFASDLVIAKVGLIISGQYTLLEKFVPSFSGQIKEAQQRLAKINTLKTEENIRRLMGDS